VQRPDFGAHKAGLAQVLAGLYDIVF